MRLVAKLILGAKNTNTKVSNLFNTTANPIEIKDCGILLICMYIILFLFLKPTSKANTTEKAMHTKTKRQQK